MKTTLRASFFVGLISLGLWAADHKEAPLVSERPPSDIADLYAFVSPDNSDNLVLIMTVNPFSVPEEGVAFNFSPGIRYAFNIDNNGDTKAEIRIGLDFAKDQSFVMYMTGGFSLPGVATPPTEEPVANDPVIATADNGVSVFAGPRDDPFFFDFVGVSRVLAGTGGFTGRDSFAGYNVSAIVVEVPLAMFGADVLNIWATTESKRQPFKDGESAKHGFTRQLDRMGNPGVATVLIPADLKDRYNQVSPGRDASEFAGPIVASLQALGTNDENIAILASVAVPDLLTINVTQPSGFPNGRAPADDVIDTLFFFIFNDAGVTDSVDANDVAFSEMFPYLASPWQPE